MSRSTDPFPANRPPPLHVEGRTEDILSDMDRITDQDEAAELLPAWLGRRLVGLRGNFGLLLATGDVLRITSVGAVHFSSDGLVLLDVSLDQPGIPSGISAAWQPRHFLGAPFPGSTEASVNLAHVVAAVEFVHVAMAEPIVEVEVPTTDELVVELGGFQIIHCPIRGPLPLSVTEVDCREPEREEGDWQRSMGLAADWIHGSRPWASRADRLSGISPVARMPVIPRQRP
jgi:hypothetical protein